MQNPIGSDNKNLRIFLVEDDPLTCADFKSYIETLNDTELVGCTNSSYEALGMIRSLKPDALVLDLELHNGSGNGLMLLSDMRMLPPEELPYILITTNNSSTTTFDTARQLGADMIMSKHQTDYSARTPVDFLRVIRASLKNNAVQAQQGTASASAPLESGEAKERREKQRIADELDILGFNNKVLGYQYLIDAIYMAATDSPACISQKLARQYGKTTTSVERAMQNAIERTWNTSPLETLLAHYTAHINPDRGMPTIMEFVSYFARKAKNNK